MITKHLLKTIAGFCGMILFGLVSLVVVDHYNKEPAEQVVDYQGTEDISEGSINAPKAKKGGPEIALLSYHETLGLYTGRRVEIADDCQISPSTMTLKNNTKVMLDNKSKALKTIKIDKTTTVKEQGFKIINLSSSKLPVKLAMSCDSQHNVATITLEK